MPWRLKVLEDENRKLKKLLAVKRCSTTLKLKDLNAKNGDARREAASCGAPLPSL